MTQQDLAPRVLLLYPRSVTTNYVDSFIAVALDCRAARGSEPRPGTIAAQQLELLRSAPYARTSDDLLFEVHARRSGIGAVDRHAERTSFFVKPRACLRASPLVKQHG
jgi:hypothetical protein